MFLFALSTFIFFFIIPLPAVTKERRIGYLTIII